MIITIDGPAGSGKSFVAKIVAEKLGFYYLYTGLLYRVVAYIWIHKLGKNVQNLDTIDFKNLNFIKKITYEYKDKNPQVFFEGENLTKHLHDMALSQPASILSAKKEIRRELLALQCNVAQKYDIVAEGRDCGSVIFPNADYKFFLTASLDVRAKRIFEDKKRINSGLDLEKVKDELQQRDERDQKRKVAPLIISKDAIIIDNSDMNKQETMEKFLGIIKKGRK